MKQNPLKHLEWISLVYLALFVLAVAAPQLITHPYLGLEEESVESVLIFIFGIIGLLIFSFYQRTVEQKDEERAVAETERERARRELIESYKYIGSINRQVNVLKDLANTTSLELVERDTLTKDIIASLLANAAASVGTPTAFIRYLDIEKGRTDHEVLHSLEGITSLKIANKDLMNLHASGATHAYIRSETGREFLVVPSDHRDVSVKAFILARSDSSTAETDISLLKVFANQADLIYHTLRKRNGLKPPILDLVKETEQRSIGDVS